jgi:hypothetical protein
LGTEFNLVDEGGASLRNLAAKLPEDSWPDFKVRAR